MALSSMKMEKFGDWFGCGPRDSASIHVFSLCCFPYDICKVINTVFIYSLINNYLSIFDT